MNYKSELQSNNTDLRAILAAINELPDATTPPETEIWSFEMEDGDIVQKEVAVY
jgi:hypothetical protein